MTPELDDLLGRYWDIAYTEGEFKKKHDNSTGDAQLVYMAIRNEFNRLVDRHKRSAEIYVAERNHARVCYDRSVKILAGIHSMMYPAPIKMEDGRTMVFRPKDPNPHEVLQELSDRIRAIPDEIAAIYPASDEPDRKWQAMKFEEWAAENEIDHDRTDYSVGLAYMAWQAAFEAGQANPQDGCITRKIFICSNCEFMYCDEPVHQCDCSFEPTEFIEGVATYAAPTPGKDKP